MLALQDENQPVDLHTLSDHLNARKHLDAVGGLVFLAELADYAATAANVLHHARIVRDKAVKRNLIRVASQIAESSYEQTDDAEHLLDEAESRIFELGQSKARTTFTSLDLNLQGALDHVEALMAQSGELTGVPTGFKDLDADTGGLQPGELIVIAARPSMGKTALALNIARNAAVDHRKKVAIFSLEMTNRALTLRLLSSQAQVNMNEFRKGYGRLERLPEAPDRCQRAGRRRPVDRRHRHDHDPRGEGEVPAAALRARARPGDARLPPARPRHTPSTSARTWRSPRSATASSRWRRSSISRWSRCRS